MVTSGVPETASAEAGTAREVYERSLALAAAGDFDGWADLHAPDAVVEIPFAPPGMPQRVEGRDEIRGVITPMQRKVREVIDAEVEIRAMHEPADANVVICEYTQHMTVRATGDSYHVPYLKVLTVRDGLIVNVRDYAGFEFMPPLGELSTES